MTNLEHITLENKKVKTGNCKTCSVPTSFCNKCQTGSCKDVLNKWLNSEVEE